MDVIIPCIDAIVFGKNLIVCKNDHLEIYDL